MGAVMSRFRLLAILSLFLLPPAYGAVSSNVPFWEPWSWVYDDVRFSGAYHAASDPKAFTWVLLHGLGSVKGEWDPFAAALAAEGSGVAVYDARGHGESSTTLKGIPMSYQSWSAPGAGSHWDKMPGDLKAAVRHLSLRYGLPMNKIAVGGASLGANVALSFAERSKATPGVLMLSPGLVYAGISIEGPFELLKPRPVFMTAAVADTYSFQSLQRLAQKRPRDPNCRVVQRPGAGHGVQLLDPEFTRTVISWVRSIEQR
jgi:pimeloyl-ACP methyl ester carboxylesterase